MPRFSLLRHDHPYLHWDFLVETGESLRTWRLVARPILGTDITCEPLAPHRLIYLDYEGPVSQNRGTVWREETGEYHLVHDDPALFACDLAGQWWRGRVTISPAETTGVLVWQA